MKARFLISRTFALSQTYKTDMIMYLKKFGFETFLKYFSFANFLILILVYVVIFAQIGSLVTYKVTNLTNHQSEIVAISHVR